MKIVRLSMFCQYRLWNPQKIIHPFSLEAARKKCLQKVGKILVNICEKAVLVKLLNKNLRLFKSELLRNWFSWILFRFFNICCDTLDLWNNKNKDWLWKIYSWLLPISNMEFFVTIVNSFEKISIFDEAGFSGYNKSYHPPLVTVKMCCWWC